MSMPSFPPCGADMSKDEALTMIIASIAMEELALSHIVNAEGEKLQYVLGTLPGGRKPCPSTQEILAVNKSAAEVLDTVMQSQMLLKGKLEKALEAGGYASTPEPPCPCESACPHCPPCEDEPCSRKSAIQLVSRCKGFVWDNGFLLTWKCQGQRGSGIRWNEEMPALVELDTRKTYVLNYTVNILGPYHGDRAGTVSVKLTPCNTFFDILPLYFSVKHLACEPLSLHYSTILFPQANPAPCANLSLLLNDGGSLSVEQASLSIVEV